ncbi:VOC family protein [Jidongwangia harbinensis]|nr:VOC family protein [Jidongwangia harbinensis]MCA2215516.1 VOC family protein [Jidongwangia harbinensis]
MCDDLDATMAELPAKGAEMALYQPKYDPPATSL